MKLGTWIAKLPPLRLEHYKKVLGMTIDPVREYEGFCSGLEACLASEETIRRTLLNQRPWVKDLVRLAVSRFGPLPFHKEDLERVALADGKSGAHVRATLEIMSHYGWVMVLRKSWGEEVFLLLEDTLAVWHRLLFPAGLKEAPPSTAYEGEPEGNIGCAAYDMLVLLEQLRGDGVQLTKSGLWPKAALKKLEGSLITSDDDVAPLQLQIRPEGAYGPAAGIIMDLTIRSGLVQLSGGAWKLTGEAVGQWVKKSVAEAQRELYKLLKPVIPVKEVWEIHALACMEQAAAGKWYLLEELFEWLGVCGMMNEITEGLLSDYVRTRLMPMQALGWIRLCRLPQGGYAFLVPYSLGDCAPEVPEMYSGLIVQSDLELILPPYPPLALLWDISPWCDTVNRGEMFALRLSRDSIRRGAAQGITGEAMVDTLNRYACGSLDPHVAGTIREWAGSARAFIRTGVALLELRDPGLCRLLEEGDDARACLSNPLTEGLYAVPLSLLGQLDSCLKRLGVISLQHQEELKHSGKAAMGGDEAQRKQPAPILVTLWPDPVCTPAPETAQPGADWERVPSAWLHRLDSYHPSTRKDMIRKAIEWKAPVRLAGDGMSDWEFIPLSIRDHGQQWMVEGLRDRERVTVLPDEWERIRILLPGVSD